MPVLRQEYTLFFCLPLSIQPRLNTQQQGRAWGGATPGARAPVVVSWALAEYSMANRKIAYTLGRGRALFLTKFLRIFFTHENSGTKFLKIFFQTYFPKKSWHEMAWNIHDTAWHAKIWHDMQYGLAWHVTRHFKFCLPIADGRSLSGDMRQTYQNRLPLL